MIPEKYFLLCVLLLAIGTFAIRSFFIVLSDRLSINHDVKKLFSYIPAAILPAMIIPQSFFHQGVVGIVGGKERLIILLLSGLLYLYVKNTLAMICFGLGLLFLATNYLS